MKKKNQICIMVLLMLMIASLSGCGMDSKRLDLLLREVDKMILYDMNFIAKVSASIDSKIINSETYGDSVRVIYENGVIFTTTMRTSHNLAEMECLFEGSSEIIDNKLRDYVEVCFNFKDPERWQMVEKALREEGYYEGEYEETLYSAKFHDGFVLFKTSTKGE